jgi:hypothetical protein
MGDGKKIKFQKKKKNREAPIFDKFTI